jgi:hypothetical protein
MVIEDYKSWKGATKPDEVDLDKTSIRTLHCTLCSGFCNSKYLPCNTWSYTPTQLVYRRRQRASCSVFKRTAIQQGGRQKSTGTKSRKPQTDDPSYKKIGDLVTREFSKLRLPNGMAHIRG